MIKGKKIIIALLTILSSTCSLCAFADSVHENSLLGKDDLYEFNSIMRDPDIIPSGLGIYEMDKHFKDNREARTKLIESVNEKLKAKG